MATQTQESSGGVALFIDWDNLAIALRDKGLAPNEKALRKFAQRYGTVLVARAYANWNQWRFVAEALFRVGIEPVFALSAVKNSADVRLAIDCCQLALPNPAIHTIVIGGGDGDLVYLVHEAHRLGKRIVFLSLQKNLNPMLTRLADATVAYEQFHAGYIAEASQALGPTQQRERKKAIEAALKATKEAVFELRRPNIDGRYPEHDAAALKRLLRTKIPDFEEEELGFERFRHFLFYAESRGVMNVDTKGEPGHQEYPMIYGPTEMQNERGEKLLAPDTWKRMVRYFSEAQGARRREQPVEQAELVKAFDQLTFEVARRSGFIRSESKDSTLYYLTSGDERVAVYRGLSRQGDNRSDGKKNPQSSATGKTSPPSDPAPLTQKPFEKLSK
jgi:uncharacterized protein (TIGR00288 family)